MPVKRWESPDRLEEMALLLRFRRMIIAGTLLTDCGAHRSGVANPRCAAH